MVMVCNDLQGVSEAVFPSGIVLDTWRPGDEEEWLRIHLLSDFYNDFTSETFCRQYGHDEREWARRLLFLRVIDGPTIGTAGAWFHDNWRGESWGRLHWVAIIPEYQGRGLARPMVGAALQRIRDLGHTRAYLTTNSVRALAIRLYETFGFHEVPATPEEAAD
jgi:GNAT superfamily N-acetyltransferase